MKLKFPWCVLAGILLALLGSARHTTAAQSEVPIYATAEEGAVEIGEVAASENLTPIAETQSGGIKWYLVKTKSGVVGWIRQGQDGPAKRADDFFRNLPPVAVGIPVQIRSGSAAAAPANAVLVPVTLSGSAVIVPVTFNRSVSGNLLLDTGASMTMISKRLANSLALAATSSGIFSGIGGTIHAPIARVDSIKVGDAEATGMSVTIHDISRFPHFEGLLGMDFLGRFQVSVDPAKKLLVLAPK